MRVAGIFPQALMDMAYLLIPHNGPSDIELEPGETLVVPLAIGGYSAAVVQVALAMGSQC